MGWHRRSYFAFSIIKTNKNPIHQYPYSTKDYFSFSRRPSILNQNQGPHFLQTGSNRFYSVSPGGFTHWLKDRCWETVPYTKRKHFVLLSKHVEREVGEKRFNNIKQGFKGKILPETDPQSVRVRMIANKIIEVVEKELNEEQILSSVDDALKALSNEKGAGGGNGNGKGGRMCHLMASKGKGMPSRYSHLVTRERGHCRRHFMLGSNRKRKRRSKIASQDLNWEVVVVDDPRVNASCMSGGKIVVYTGMLEHCTSDAEIASMIGHEVGHLVARHHVEMTTKDLGLVMMLLVLYPLVTPYLAVLISTLFVRLYFRRKMELEADYIGVMLIASAGYDPWVASTNYFKLAKLQRRSELQSALIEFMSMHPSRLKRALLLARSQVMDEALHRYKETQARNGEKGCE